MKPGDQNQKWSRTRGTKIRSGCRTPALPRGPKQGGNAMSPCILGDPECEAQGPKSELAASPLPSRGPKKGRKCYVTPAVFGVPKWGFKKAPG